MHTECWHILCAEQPSQDGAWCGSVYGHSAASELDEPFDVCPVRPGRYINDRASRSRVMESSGPWQNPPQRACSTAVLRPDGQPGLHPFRRPAREQETHPPHPLCGLRAL